MAEKLKPKSNKAIAAEPAPAAALDGAKVAPKLEPSIGRIVHYVLPEKSNRAGRHRAAIVAGVHGDAINLTVFLDSTLDMPSDHGTSKRYDVAGKLMLHAYDVEEDPEGERPGSWHWPERV